MYWFLKILSSIPLYGQKNGIAHCQATPSQKQMEISPRAHQQKMFFLAPFLEVTVGKLLQYQFSIFWQIVPPDMLS